MIGIRKGLQVVAEGMREFSVVLEKVAESIENLEDSESRTSAPEKDIQPASTPAEETATPAPKAAAPPSSKKTAKGKTAVQKPAKKSVPKAEKKPAKKSTRKTETKPADKDGTDTEIVLSMIRNSPDGVDLKDIRETTGFKHKKVSNIIQRAFQRKLIERVNTGRYKAVNQ